jgi:retinol dehydrogenase 14
MLIDLSLQHSVRSMVAGFEERYDHLDVLINNAGIFKNRRAITADGLETMFATNHLGPFLLTNLLLDKLKNSASAGVLSITAPSTTPLNFNAYTAFGASKMCNLLFTYELARRLEGTHVTANAIHPGLVKSGIMKEAAPPIRWFTYLISTAPRKAAETPVYYASSPEVEGMTGLFFRGRQVIQSNSYSTNVEVQKRLWDVSVALTGPG